MNNYIDIENKDKSITKTFIMGMKHSKKYGYDFLVCIVKTKVVMYAIKKVNDNFYKYDITNLVVISNLNNEFQDENNKYLDTNILPKVLKHYNGLHYFFIYKSIYSSRVKSFS